MLVWEKIFKQKVMHIAGGDQVKPGPIYAAGITVN